MYDIAFLNRLSRTLCEAVNETERREAEETLSKLVDSKQCLENCLALLEKGDQPYAQVVASGALKRLLNKKISLNVPERLQLSRYLLKYLVSMSTLPIYILNPLCKLFAVLTKVGWLEREPQTDNFPFQMPVSDLLVLAKETTNEGLLALRVLNALVEEANSDEGLDSISKQRKISSDFRDNRLLDIFILSLDFLKAALGKQLDDTELARVSHALDLAINCMNYDFIGSMVDETLDENVNIQVPTKWRPALIDRQVINLFFDLYFSLPQEMITKAFQTLILLASVRRMLFDTQDRQKYLDQMVSGLKRVLESAQKLSYPDNFHQFCRILSRVKANYQVSELVKCEDFSALLRLLTDFSLQSLQMSHLFTQNSIFYLMSFWSRVAGSLSYARVDVEMISACIPRVCSAFIQSRVLLCEMVVREGIEDPLDDIGSVKQMMELFTVIARKEYKRTIEELIQYFEESLAVLLRPDATTAQEQLVAKKRIIWLITMMAAGVKGKGSSNSNEPEDDLYDGEVVCRVWKTMQVTDQRLDQQQPTPMDIQLEFAYIYLMDEFRKAYISEQVQRDSQVYEKLGTLGVNDDAGVLRLFAQKIITNLKYWGKDEKILSSTLSLLNELTIGYANVRRLLKTEEVQLLLRNHSAFDFVASNEEMSIMRSRTTFYASLMRLLSIELEEDISIFNIFMDPIYQKFKTIYMALENEPLETATAAQLGQLRMAIIGLVRELRGIAVACTKKSHNLMFLNWCLPNVFLLMEKAVKLWADIADVTTPILKLIAEMTLNRQSRLTYDMHNTTAVVLFKSLSKVICEYGNRALALPPVSNQNHYKQRLKNTGVISHVLRNVLSGNYLPFGVFYLYGDTCLSDALDVNFKLFLRLQEENFLAYTKLSQAIYYFLDIVTKDNMAYVSKLDEHFFIAILRAVHKGIHTVDTTVISSCCQILDQVLDYVFERLTGPVDVSLTLCREPEGDKWKSALAKEPDILYELLTSIMSQLLFEEVKCQWSMSRPLLGLIILNAKTNRYEECKNEFIRSQPPALQPALDQAFARLMEGIKDNVTQKNKDNFTQNLSSFRKEVEAILKGIPINIPNPSVGTEQEFNNDNMTED